MTPRELFVGFTTSLAASVAYGFIGGIKGSVIVLSVLLAGQLIFHFFYYYKGLVIHQAWHGIGPEQYADVTLLLRGYIRDDKVNIPIDGSTFPHDPSRGERKHVRVVYSYRTWKKHEKIKHDGDRLMLP